ncbi:RNA-binding domain-containing protein [Nonomuraea antri]|uniref:RNA-binding domain-containing protein n=1 Tax=Nonomuraea antri TaxID=2730852 RepID=UPI001F45CB5C|nr:RNA-binding domain-containing protein [Nonomuraea antri]
MEFKQSIPNVRTVARELAAMANTHGGLVAFGIKETAEGPALSGVDSGRMLQVIDRAAQSLKPVPPFSTHVLDAGDKSLVIVEVEPASGGPVTVLDGEVVVRAGSHVRPAAAQDLVEQQSSYSSSDEMYARMQRLAEVVADQTQAIASLREALEKTGNWRRQLYWCIAGALLGTILGAIATLIIGD